MKTITDLPLVDQAAVVLLTILEDIASGQRTMAGVETHVADLFNMLSASYDIPFAEVKTVADSVARYGVQMLPGNIQKESDDGPGPAEAQVPA